MMRQQSSSTVPSRDANQQKVLPPGYIDIQGILEGSVSVGSFISVIGLVKDRRAPIQTGSTDWKSTLTIFDKSIDDEPDKALSINIFRAEKEMPEPNARDVVLLHFAKVQSYRGEISLISNWKTSIHIYSANKIPKPPKSAKVALEPPLRSKDRLPGDKEHEYVSWLYHSIDRYAVPDAAEFTIQVERSKNIKDKFQTLKDVHDGMFCDVIASVVKEPFGVMDRVTLWISDYTENEYFYKFSWDATEVPEGRDGDPYGYTTAKNPASNGWLGPYGKRSMQVTCFGTHGEYVIREAKVGSWIQLRNVQVKYGHNANNLEGYLREDQSAYKNELRVDILTIDDPDTVDSRLKDAIKRKRDYEKAKKKQQKGFAANNNGKANGGERMAEGQGGMNSKTKRARERALKVQEVEKKELEVEAKLGLNGLVKCESIDQPVFSVSSIVEPITWTTTVEGREVTLTLPFVCAKYRANVRVVDFWPRKLENFATWRKSEEYDVLSDHSGGSDLESDGGQGTLDRFSGDKIWEWRFALLLEEASPKRKDECNRVWAIVEDAEAQMLINMNASDLRANPDELDNLREQMFKLWGNLEECKQQELQRLVSNKKRVAAHQPPPTSPLGPAKGQQAEPAAKTGLIISNKPFTCCIRQYGVEVREEDPQKANATNGKRWERVFGLFGTKIS
ncbi:uncharacterized protein F4822DRAFT_394300 [Hypoxylon trugodes]|uniref:uncharacterized protein n=1 Tax=Hypoxylon trugodes TaxID=326681 RepID=UPI0021980C82|nr:uncharacterized protein F4822DRAFT_394300 [Hypoxylon trugodes]KAI1390733.1 hypothetical protein F4822DRAFT_394300 [Hypoxylon trugodes]